MNQSTKRTSLLPAHAKISAKTQPASHGFVSGILWGMAFCTSGGLAFLLLGSLIAFLSPDPDALIPPLGFGAMILSCLLGGIGIGLRCDQALLPCSLLCGCIYVGFGLLLGLLFGTELRQALTLGLGLVASLGIRAGLVALFCAAAVLTSQIKGKLSIRPKRHR